MLSYHDGLGQPVSQLTGNETRNVATYSAVGTLAADTGGTEGALEVDAIVETADGRWGPFEIKLGLGQVDAAATTLGKFANRVDIDRCGPPAVLGVIVASGYGYVRDDDVAVIPIGSLRL